MTKLPPIPKVRVLWKLPRTGAFGQNRVNGGHRLHSRLSCPISLEGGRTDAVVKVDPMDQCADGQRSDGGLPHSQRGSLSG